MSWRRFCLLYSGLSATSAVYRNYDRVAKKEGIRDAAREESAWAAFSGLSRPDGGV